MYTDDTQWHLRGEASSGKPAGTKAPQKADFQINKEGKKRVKVPASKRRVLTASVDSPSDYYYRFKRFCSFYPLREHHLACSILDALGKLPNSLSSFSILDVGSSDGTLLAEMIGLLRASSDIDLHCVAIEPEPIAFARLEVMATLLRKQWNVAIGCIQANIEDVMAGRQSVPIEKFDCIFCSHVFYHLQDWPGVITDSFSRLSPGGCIVVILDSHNSPIYQFKESLETTLGNHVALQQYGDFTSAEKFLKFLRSRDISYSYSELDWKLTLAPGRLTADLEDILTFLYRFPVNGRKRIQRAVQNFATRFQCGAAYMFPWKDGLFAIPKDRS